MSLDADFDALYSAQTEFTGTAIVATVTGYATSKPALLEVVNENDILVSGGSAEGGGYSLRMKASDFSSEPPKQTPVTCNGAAEGNELEVFSVANNNGIYYIQLADFAAQ
jgi:hypothetical protein